MSEWKSGDVGLNLKWGYRGIFVANCRLHGGVDHWHNQSGANDPADDGRRPLVVIDPEDREQVERLRDIYDVAVIQMHDDPDPRDVTPEQRTTAMQAALRELADPTPRIEEPTGLGAVVATEGDGDYVRVSVELLNPWLNVQTGTQVPWDRVNANRVLSEGVKAGESQ